jgi:nitroreductase
VLLLEDVRRRVPFADPTGKDAMISLGAAFEGMSLALSYRELGFGALESVDSPDGAAADGAATDGGPYRLVASTTLVGAGAPDPLAELVTRRRTYRGRFEADARALENVRDLVDAQEGLSIIEAPAEIAALARAHDRSSYRFLETPEVQAELYEWLRFTPVHPDWHRDGLTADCMAMSSFEARAAVMLFRPGMFRALKLTGLGRLATAEAGATRSAAALLVLHQSPDLSWFEAGRSFYRTWLELTRLGLSACPMSALTDDPDECASLRTRCGLAPNAAVINVLRVGKAPPDGAPKSPRVPPNELVV